LKPSLLAGSEGYHRAMKKFPARARRSTAKPNSAPRSVEEYLAGVPGPARSALQKVRAIIRSVVPVGTTELISHRIPAFKHKKVIVWYAAFADHCSLYPTASVIARFKNELKAYRVSKGTIQFPVDKGLPAALLKKIIRARLAEIDLNWSARL
jgi:uncharacterized protein YdhG (YjbR/CyaY superfamily)